MGWIGENIEKLRRLSGPYFIMYVMAKFLFGVGLGLLLATWLSVWTGWVFIAVSLLVGIPSARIFLRR